MSVRSADGYHTVNFSGSPGDALLIFVRKSGPQEVTFRESGRSGTSSTAMAQVNTFGGLIISVLYAVISIPVLGRLLRK